MYLSCCNSVLAHNINERLILSKICRISCLSRDFLPRLYIAIQLFFPAEKVARQLLSKAMFSCSWCTSSKSSMESNFQWLVYDGTSSLAIELEIPDTIHPRPRRIPAPYESHLETHLMCPVETFKERTRREDFALIDRWLTIIKDWFQQPWFLFWNWENSVKCMKRNPSSFERLQFYEYKYSPYTRVDSSLDILPWSAEMPPSRDCYWSTM